MRDCVCMAQRSGERSMVEGRMVSGPEFREFCFGSQGVDVMVRGILVGDYCRDGARGRRT